MGEIESQEGGSEFNAALANCIDQMVFGPVDSRRFGRSLGINLFPGKKICNYKCVYCECDMVQRPGKAKVEVLTSEGQDRLVELLVDKSIELGDVQTLTYAGNGEPTLHPNFVSVYHKLAKYRDQHHRRLKIALLTNGALLDQSIVDAFAENGDTIQVKFDTGSDALFELLNGPSGINLTELTSQLALYGQKIELQTMILDGHMDGTPACTYTTGHWDAFLERVQNINPSAVHLYTLQRPSKAQDISRTSPAWLRFLARSINDLGIRCEFHA